MTTAGAVTRLRRRRGVATDFLSTLLPCPVLHGLLAVGIGLGTLCPTSSRAAERWFPVSGNDWFRGWRDQLQELVNEVPGQPESRLCVVAQQNADDVSTLQAYVIWPAQHRLIIWIPSRDDEHSLVHATRVLDLERDIVPSQKDIGTSNYLEDRAWLANIERHCKASGTMLELAPDGRH